MPTGAIKDVKGTPLDFATLEAISARGRLDTGLDAGGKPGVDHPFVVNGWSESEPKMNQVAVLSGFGHQMSVKSTQPCVVCYTSNWIPPSSTKHTMHGAVCLETCGFPDGINHRGEPKWQVEPWCSKDKPYRHTTVHTFEKID